MNRDLMCVYFFEWHLCGCEHVPINCSSLFLGFGHSPIPWNADIIARFTFCQDAQPAGQHAPHQSRLLSPVKVECFHLFGKYTEMVFYEYHASQGTPCVRVWVGKNICDIFNLLAAASTR
jgi:hypothetical protein